LERESTEEKQKTELSVIKIYQENLILDLKFTHSYIEFLEINVYIAFRVSI